MTPKVAPYEKAIRMLLLLIVVGYIFQRLFPTVAASEVMGGLTGLSVGALLACSLGAYKAYTELRRGFLYPLRTVSFYLGIFSVLIGVGWMAYEIAIGSPEAGQAVMWTAVLTGSFVLSMPYLYLDDVRLEHRIGFITTVLPIFGIQRIVEEEGRMLVRGNEGIEITVFEGQLGTERYYELRERVNAIR